jgi:integrase
MSGLRMPGVFKAEGVVLRHSRGCASFLGSGCDCSPAFQAQVYARGRGKTVRRSFRSLAEARAWRAQAQVDLRRGALSVPTRVTLAQAAETWLAAAEVGVVRTRSGRAYKPSALRTYRGALGLYLLPSLGSLRLSAITRNRVQDLVDGLVAAGHAPSTVRNAVLPLRAIYRRAVEREEVSVNPTVKLRLPAVLGRRERVACPVQARALLDALPVEDRAWWAIALYAGLRRGELMALGWEHVDLDAGLIRVERSWDRRAGFIEPKSRAGVRRVPLPSALRAELVALALRHGRPRGGLVFSRDGERPLDSSTMSERAKRAWRTAGVDPVGLHECRHSYASLMIAAGVNAKSLCAYMGHSSITVTLDRYGHLLPGNEVQAAGLLDRYLDAAVRSVS